MKTVFTLLPLALALSCTQLHAKDGAFQHEVTLDYGAMTDSSDSGSLSAQYNFYASPVEQSQNPYQLAGFLAQSSQINVNYNTNTDGNTKYYDVGGEYVFGSKWFVGAGVSKSEYDASGFDSTYYSISTGMYFNDFSKFYVSYGRGEFNFNQYESTSSTWSAGISSYLRLQSTEGIKLDAYISNTNSDLESNSAGILPDDSYSDSSTYGSISADWFITRAWSIGANYNVDENDDTYGLNTGYYLRLTDLLSAQFGFSHQFGTDYTDSINTYSVSLNGRF